MDIRAVPAPLACTLAALTVTLTACGDGVPTSPQDPGPAAGAAVAGGPGVVASVKGGAHYDLLNPPDFVGDFKWIYDFSIRATARADGSAEGTVLLQSHIPPGRNDAGVPLDWWAEIAIDCVEVDGDMAWLTGSFVRTRTDSPFGPQVNPDADGSAMLIVRQMGPGQLEVNVGPSVIFGGADDCHDRPPMIPGNSMNGNITIAGGT
jgi:hypothetical protein